MDAITIDVLEFSEVLSELSGFSASEAGKELALKVRPFKDLDNALKAQALLREADSILKELGPLPLGDLYNLQNLLNSHMPEGGFFELDSLLRIRSTAHVIESLRLMQGKELADKYPLFSVLLSSLSPHDALLKKLRSVIDRAGNIKDKASPNLFRIRRELSSSKERCRAVVEKFLRDKDSADLLQEDFFTIRDDRYVLTIKAERHSHFPGVVHGRSKSGATFFIEPLQTVEINNKVAILKNEEKAEEILILRELTSIVLLSKYELIKDVSTSGEIDLLQAKARFKESLGATLPLMTKCGEIKFKSARHPILILKEKDGGGAVTPVDIFLKEGKRVLIISGANAGGKTVALKTLGLFVLMAESGLALPVEEGSTFPFFEALYADIGDRQNISQDLSTFSAHLKRTGEVLRVASEKTLVLIDEIGVGTDPAEGSVFSLSILEELRNRGTVAVVTTHLNLLKAHAGIDKTFENASVVFDEETLRPRYSLCYGVPGASLGLSVATRYGIPDEIVSRARARLKGDEGAFVDAMRIIESKKESLIRTNENLEKNLAEKEHALKRLRDDREKLLKSAREKINKVIKKSKEDFSLILKEAREATQSKDFEELKKIKKNAGKKEEKLKVIFSAEEKKYVPSVGDEVLIGAGGGGCLPGIVTKIDSTKKRAEVLSRNLKVWSDWKRLEFVRRGVLNSKKISSEVTKPEKNNNDTENFESTLSGSVNIIGLRADEALGVLEKALDNAHMDGVGRLEVIHGVGTGALKHAVEEYLKDNKIVRGFKSGAGSGSSAITIVEVL